MAAETVPVWLGHGASGGPETMEPYLRGLRSRGLDARALRLPKGSAERAMPALREQVGEELSRSGLGGHSFGGRVASMVAAEQAPAALVLLSYPLHRPGHPEELRVDHWPRITCPALVLSGDRDPFARIDLLRTAVGSLASAEGSSYMTASAMVWCAGPTTSVTESPHSRPGRCRRRSRMRTLSAAAERFASRYGGPRCRRRCVKRR